MFEDNWMGTNGPWRWPARSPYLTPVIYFYFGNNQVYWQSIIIKENLKNRISQFFATIRPGKKIGNGYKSHG